MNSQWADLKDGSRVTIGFGVASVIVGAVFYIAFPDPHGLFQLLIFAPLIIGGLLSVAFGLMFFWNRLGSGGRLLAVLLLLLVAVPFGVLTIFLFTVLIG